VTKKGVANKVMAFPIKLVSPYESAAIVLHKPCVANGVEVDEFMFQPQRGKWSIYASSI
jgi:hypothetical protein